MMAAIAVVALAAAGCAPKGRPTVTNNTVTAFAGSVIHVDVKAIDVDKLEGTCGPRNTRLKVWARVTLNTGEMINCEGVIGSGRLSVWRGDGMANRGKSCGRAIDDAVRNCLATRGSGA